MTLTSSCAWTTTSKFSDLQLKLTQMEIFRLFSFAILENIRYMLYQYHTQTSLYFGHRFTLSKKEVDHFEGFMAGKLRS
jgi:hypothetical protein